MQSLLHRDAMGGGEAFGKELPFRILQITELLAEGLLSGDIRVNKVPTGGWCTPESRDCVRLDARSWHTSLPTGFVSKSSDNLQSFRNIV